MADYVSKESPMGWFYRVAQPTHAAGNPTVMRCVIGTAWEKMEIYDIGEFSPDELRFLAQIIEASASPAPHSES